MTETKRDTPFGGSERTPASGGEGQADKKSSQRSGQSGGQAGGQLGGQPGAQSSGQAGGQPGAQSSGQAGGQAGGQPGGHSSGHSGGKSSEESGGNRVGGKAGEAASRVTEGARGVASQVVTSAREFVQAEASKRATQGAEGLGEVATALRHTSEEMDDNFAGRCLTKAAERVDAASGYLRTAQLDQVLGSASNFARQSPGLFLGGAFALGLLGARFVKSGVSSVDSEFPSGSSRGVKT